MMTAPGRRYPRDSPGSAGSAYGANTPSDDRLEGRTIRRVPGTFPGVRRGARPHSGEHGRTPWHSRCRDCRKVAPAGPVPEDEMHSIDGLDPQPSDGGAGMELSIQAVLVSVSDLERSIKFYREVFDLRLASEGDRVAARLINEMGRSTVF